MRYRCFAAVFRAFLFTLSRVWHAIAKSYGWKSPIETTKDQQFSLVLWMLAGLFFLFRLTWGVQLLKVVIRTIRGASPSIHPLLSELYVLISVGGALAVLVCAQYDVVIWHQPDTAVALIAAWKISECLSSNLYYLLFRPVLERNSPHNLYRSMVLALLSFCEVWLLLCIVWLFAGDISKSCTGAPTVQDVCYFTTVTFFTLGYGEWTPSTPASQWLVVFTMFSYLSAFVLVIGRALAIVAPLPTETSRRVLLFVCGLPGSGKSTLSAAISDRWNIVLLNSDFVHDAFDTDDRSSEDYLARRDQLYEAIYRTAFENIAIGNNVLIDAPLTKAITDVEWCRRFRDFARDNHFDVYCINCSCDDETLRRRLIHRGAARDRDKLQDDAAWKAYLDASRVDGKIDIPHCCLSTDSSVDTLLQEVEPKIGKWLRQRQ